MIVNGRTTYIATIFDDEAEIEKVVQTYAKQLFGEAIIYLPKAKILTVGGIGTIPDGFVIDIEREEWFIVEAELASHRTWEHIAPQVAKQLAAAETQKTRESVINLALKLIRSDVEVKNAFKDLGVEDIDIHGKLRNAVSKAPKIAIPIDGIPTDLREWARTLRSTVNIWVIEKFVSVNDANDIFYLLPDENLPTITTKAVKDGSVTIVNSAKGIQVRHLIDAKMLTEGQRLIIDYTPKNGSKQNFEGVVRREGIEVDGVVYAPSRAALLCLQKANKSLISSNGWQYWKTEGNVLLSFLRDSLANSTEATNVVSEENQVDDALRDGNLGG